MATYAVGDIQGCYDELQRLLEVVDFDPSMDQVWLTGDLVNRGPDSLRVLRWAREQGDRVVTVLGNHDLHLLAVAAGGAPTKRRDTLDAILEAPDSGGLLEWLRHRKLMHVEAGWAMVHAGLLPQWSIEQALELAHEVEVELRAAPRRLLGEMYGDEPSWWSEELAGTDRWRVAINAFTRLRMLDRQGRMALSFSDAPAKAPPGHTCWFDAVGRASAGTPIVCGHWAALGLVTRHDLVSIDTGCVWGRELTAFRLEDRRVFQVACARR